MLRDLVAHALEQAQLLDRVGDVGMAVDGCDVVALVDPGPAEWLAVQNGSARVMVLRWDSVDDEVVEDVRRGADAVVGVEVGAEEIVLAARAVAGGGCWLPATSVRGLVDALRRTDHEPEPMRLTGRERDILRCAADGLSVKQTARSLGVAPKTVENLQSRLFRKLGVRNRAQAVAVSHSAGLLDDPLGEITSSASSAPEDPPTP